MRGVALADAKGSSDFLRDDDSAQIVHPADDACCFHISSSPCGYFPEVVFAGNRELCGSIQHSANIRIGITKSAESVRMGHNRMEHFITLRQWTDICRCKLFPVCLSHQVAS